MGELWSQPSVCAKLHTQSDTHTQSERESQRERKSHRERERVTERECAYAELRKTLFALRNAAKVSHSKLAVLIACIHTLKL